MLGKFIIRFPSSTRFNLYFNFLSLGMLSERFYADDTLALHYFFLVLILYYSHSLVSRHHLITTILVHGGT